MNPSRWFNDDRYDRYDRYRGGPYGYGPYGYGAPYGYGPYGWGAPGPYGYGGYPGAVVVQPQSTPAAPPPRVPE
jgi:hypothetical protein